MKRFRDSVRVAGNSALADEIGIHKGVAYATRAVGDRNLLRVARDPHTDSNGHAIAPGDVYAEVLVNGTRATGMRVCLACASKPDYRGTPSYLFVGPALERWDREAQAWVPLEVTR